MSRQEKSKQQIKGEAPKKQRLLCANIFRHFRLSLQIRSQEEEKKKIPGRGLKRTETVQAALMCLFWTGRSHPRVSWLLTVRLAKSMQASLTDSQISDPAEPSRDKSGQSLAGSLSKIITRALASAVFVFRQPPEKLHRVRFHFKGCECMVGVFAQLAAQNLHTLPFDQKPLKN